MRKALGLLLAVVVLSGCKKDPPPVVNPAPVVNPEEKCVDDWLAAKKLDAYGNPEGTMYAGGSPLFDEATGTTRNRLSFVYHVQPDAKAACQPTVTPKPIAP